MKRFLSYSLALAVGAVSYVAQAQMTNADLTVGDTVIYEGKEYIVGPNLITNGSFSELSDEGVYTGWTVGGGITDIKSQEMYDNLEDGRSYQPMTTSAFTHHQTGGFDGGAYIQSLGSGGADDAKSIVTRWTIEPQQLYYFTFWLKGNSENNQFVPVVSVTSERSKMGGYNEYTGYDKKYQIRHNGTTLLGKNGDDPSESSFGYANYDPDGNWVQTSIFFNSQQNTWLQYNARWISSSVCFDGFYLSRLYDPETAPVEDMLVIQLSGLVEEASARLLLYEDYVGIYGELDEARMDAESMIGGSVEDMRAAVNSLRATMSSVAVAYESALELEKLILEATNLLDRTAYPGLDDLALAIETQTNILWEGYSADIIAAVEAMKNAIKDYNLSQEYSEDAPADYTFLVTAPQFCIKEAEPTVVDGIFNYPNVANYTNSQSNSDSSSEGWYKGAFTAGDQRLNYVQQRMCWNAWATSFDEVSINQDITGIPNGYYTVSADLTTQAGCVTDQRVYAKSALSEAESAPMNADNVYWMLDAPYEGRWETLTSAKVMVSDGKLTIGAKGTGDTEHLPTEFGGTHTDYRRGWFCVTNFKLHYYGPLSEEDTKAAFEKKIAEMQAQCDTMTFKGDKTAYQDSINKYKTASSIDEMNEALAALAVAQTTAAASIEKQVSVKSGITAALTDSIDNGAYEGDYLTMATKFRDCMLAEINAEDATYTEMDSIVQILYSFRDSYVPTLVEARALVVTDSEAKAVLDKNINDQVTDFTTMEALPLQTKIEKYVADLETAIAECEAFNLFQSGTKDYTSMIVNSDITNSSSNSVTGWNVTVVNGNTHSANKQQVDGDVNGRYLDSWNGTVGALSYNAYQTINYLPNGTYKLEAMTRTSGDTGAYLYAMADEDSTTTKLSLIELETMNITELGGPYNSAGEDSIGVVMDTYGSIFADLYKRTDGGATAEGAQADTLLAHDGKGYGWHYTNLEIEVKNHVLTIGVTTDSTFTEKYGGEPFTGTWFSADNFTLKMIAEGDNSDWNPTTGITAPGEAVENELEIKVVDGTIVSNGEIYSLSGVRVASGSKVPAGVYIVRLGDQSKKVLVK